MTLCMHKVMTLSVHKVMTLGVHNPLTQNRAIPDTRDKIGEKLEVLARLSGFEGGDTRHT